MSVGPQSITKPVVLLRTALTENPFPWLLCRRYSSRSSASLKLGGLRNSATNADRESRDARWSPLSAKANLSAGGAACSANKIAIRLLHRLRTDMQKVRGRQKQCPTIRRGCGLKVCGVTSSHPLVIPTTFCVTTRMSKRTPLTSL
jgi:hypothetical protein